MRYFDQQQAASRKQSKRLVFLMTIMQILTVLISGAVFGLTIAIIGLFFHWENAENFCFWTTMLLGSVLAMPVVALIIVVAARLKFEELKSGGRKIAELLKAEKLPVNTSATKSRQLLNIIEEMAIASSIPPPPVFVMHGEPGVNALAAGNTELDAVIIVTDGAINLLSRDQMQGVIAHEFAHILNGDIGRNMWLMAFTHGNFCVGIVAEELIEFEAIDWAVMTPFVSLAGYILRPLGLLGTFLALAFMSRIKRIGEFRADATAVELTRLPDGLSGALLRGAGNAAKGGVKRKGGFETSHLFFVENGWSFASIFASHPPLNQRVIRLKPDWDGHYLYESDDDANEFVGTYKAMGDMLKPADKRESFAQQATCIAVGAAAMSALAGSSSSAATSPSSYQLEEDTPPWINANPSAVQIEVDPILREMAQVAEGAGLILAAIRIGQFEQARQEEIKQILNPLVSASLLQLLPEITKLDDAQRLTLFDLCLESIATAPQPVKALLAQFVEQTRVPEEAESCLARWAWQRMVSRRIEGTPKPTAQFGCLSQLKNEAVGVISVVINAESGSQAEGQYAFMRAAGHTGLEQVNMLAPEDCSAALIDYCLDRLALLAAREKQKVLFACGAVVSSNRFVNLEEAWVIRAVCCGLHYPLPAMVPGQNVSSGV